MKLETPAGEIFPVKRTRSKQQPPSVSIGKRFGRLVVIKLDGRDKRNHAVMQCLCDCGEIKKVKLSDIRSGNTTSCGCYLKSIRRTMAKKHGLCQSSEYQSWMRMIQRTTNPNHDKWKFYGGRGITVCEKWIKSFKDFYRDMGPRPKGTSIDRIDNEGNYEPSNCRWATKLQQASNTRTNVFVFVDGVRMIISEAKRRTGINRDTISRNLKQNGFCKRNGHLIKPAHGLARI